MRRVVIAGVLGLGGLAAFASPAFATYHEELVNEVMLAGSGGDHSAQFVELLDHGGAEEAFTPLFAPYKIAVYDAAGNRRGDQTLDPNGLRTAAMMDTEYLISTQAADSAFGVTGNERLGFKLPSDAGQVCFEGSPTPPPVSCMLYGPVSNPVPTNSQGTGTVHGPLPPDGESDQRQPDNTVQVAPPTPKARNRAGMGFIPPGGSGSMPGPSGTTPTPSGTTFTGASFVSRRARLGHKGRVGVDLSCSAGASSSCTGILTLQSRRGHHRLGQGSFTLSRGVTALVRVKLSRKALRQLRRRRRLVVTATVTVHDATGQSKTSSTQLTLVAAP